MNKQSGFTLIELVMVIVILGILAATALPKFTDLSGDAAAVAVQDVAGALTSASSTNFAAKKMGHTAVTLDANNECVEVSGVAPVEALLEGAAVPTGYAISGTGDCRLATGNTTISCTVTHSDGTHTATAVIYCAR